MMKCNSKKKPVIDKKKVCVVDMWNSGGGWYRCRLIWHRTGRYGGQNEHSLYLRAVHGRSAAIGQVKVFIKLLGLTSDETYTDIPPKVSRLSIPSKW